MHLSFKYSIALGSVCISIALVLFILWHLDYAVAVRLLSCADKTWLLASFILISFVPLSMTLRWSGTLYALSQDIPFWFALKANMLALFLNSFIPSKGGDISKALLIRKRFSLSIGLGTVILERAVDLAVLDMLASCSLFLTPAPGTFFYFGTLFITCALLLLSLALLLPLGRLQRFDKIHNALLDFRSVFSVWRRSPKAIIMLIGGSLLNWLILLAVICLLAKSFGITSHFLEIIAAFPTAILVGLVPITVSGIGARDSALVFMLHEQLGYEVSTLIALGYTVLGYWWLSLLSSPVVLYTGLQIRKEFLKK